MALKKVRVESVAVVNEYTCDRCGEKASGRITCEACGRDLCVKCTTWDTSEDGDYSPGYCKNCWKRGKKYRERIDAIVDPTEDILEEWKDECIAARK